MIIDRMTVNEDQASLSYKQANVINIVYVFK